MNDETKRKIWLYVLRLEQGKFYVGITTQTPEKRFQEHRNKTRTAHWTLRYKPLGIHQTKDLGSTTISRAKTIENQVVREYIKKYGVNSTRGGDITFREDLALFRNGMYDKGTFQMFLLAIAFITIAFLLAMYVIYLRRTT